MTNDSSNLISHQSLQVSSQHLAVQRAASDWPHRTADDVIECVLIGMALISQKAVYDSLRMPTEKVFIRLIQPDWSSNLYEDRVGDNQHHVIYRTCGKTDDVDCAVGTTACRNAAHDKGHQIDGAEEIFWGIFPGYFSQTSGVAD